MTGALFQAAVDRALGAVGRAFGEPYAVYRITQNSGGDFPTGWSRRTTQVVLHRNRTGIGGIESAIMSQRTVWFEIYGDVSAFLLGDVFVSADPPYYPGVGYGEGATARTTATLEFDGMALAWHSQAQVPIGARIDRRVGIYRPSLAPTPGPGGVPNWNTTHEQDTPLLLSGGVCRWGAIGAKAHWMPCGFASNDREFRQGPFPPDGIGTIGLPRYFAYLPPLPGYEPAEGDAIITEEDARYVVTAPYWQDIGAVGSQLMLERVISGTD